MFTGLSLPALLDELAAPREVPGAGSALAVALASAAAVVQMAARLSPESWADAAGVATQAEALRDRAARLVDDDAEAYGRALEARAAADTTARPEQRDWSLGRVTAAAAEPPCARPPRRRPGQLCAAAGARVEPRVHADVAGAPPSRPRSRAGRESSWR